MRRELGTSLLAWIPPLLMGLVISGLCAWCAWRASGDGLLADGYIYLLMADALQYAPASDALDWRFLFGEYPFPPLYPLLLAVVQAGADKPLQAFMLNAGLLGAAFVVLARWYASLGIPAGPALALSLSFALLPISFLTALDVQSEPLYLLLSLTALYAVSRAPARPGAWLVAGVCCGLAVLTRTVGITLLAAFTLTLLLQAPPRRVLALLCAWLPPAGWLIFRHLEGLTASYFNQRAFAANNLFGSLWQVGWVNWRAAGEAVSRSVDLQAAAPVQIALAVLGVCAGVVFLRRLGRGRCDAVYLLSYLGLIMLWPYPEHFRRFLFVVLPLAGGYAMSALDYALRSSSSRRSASAALYALPCVLLSLTTPSLLALRQELAAPSNVSAVSHTPARYLWPSLRAAVLAAQAFDPVVTLLRHARTELPAQACIASAIPEQVMYYARRPSLHLIHGLAAPASVLRQCPYVLMIAFRSFPASGVPPMFPFDALRAELEILDVARVDPDDSTSGARAILARYRGAED